MKKPVFAMLLGGVLGARSGLDVVELHHSTFTR